ncbi:hypothetical protein ACVWYH_006574 [Bradyrhizobium sp. GM24.11]
MSSLPGMSFSECIAAWSSPDSTAARICATKAPPLPPWGNSLLVWSRSPVVSNLTISTSRSGMAAVKRRAISSVCASAIALLRVPILNRVAKSWSFQCASSYLSMILSENRFPLCANAALRVRIMLYRASSNIISDAFSAIMMIGALVFPETRSGMIEPSTTRKASSPLTFSRWSTTASASLPIRQVEVGW